MTKKTIFIISVTAIFFANCKKKVQCDNAQLCVKNTGNGVIHYAWNGNIYTDSLMPGQSACKYVGPIKITRTKEQVVWVDFESDHGNYRIKVDNCTVEKEIQ